MIKKINQLILYILLISFVIHLQIKTVFAQDTNQFKQAFFKAEVVSILESGKKPIIGTENSFNSYQKVKIKLLDGPDSGMQFVIDHGGDFSISENLLVKEKEQVVLTKIVNSEGKGQYQIIDKYRIDRLISIGFLFVFLVLLLSRWKGIGSLLGMVLSLLVIVKFVVPQILNGKDPLMISIIGAIFILVTSIYLAHGFSKQTSIAVLSTSITLIATGLLSVLFVNMTKLSGISNEDTLSLQFGPTASINFKGLLLGGMIIGFLGVLDDITTGLSATVFELKKVNPKISFNDLIKSTLNIGREHISSLVNTLVLAYAGASLPIFLYIVLNPQGYPLWFIINSEFISEEIIRTLVGSIGLLFAVPITTFLAAWFATNKKQ